jgi:hypothetical protein
LRATANPRFAILRATMGLYSQFIFPRLMDWVMSGEVFRQLRTELLKDAHGVVLKSVSEQG